LAEGGSGGVGCPEITSLKAGANLIIPVAIENVSCKPISGQVTLFINTPTHQHIKKSAHQPIKKLPNPNT